MTSTFHNLGLSKDLSDVLAELGYEQATPIQTDSIPLLLAGKDLIAQSMTGSGKTAAFALPMLQKLALGTRHPQALVLCPTRELCAQVARELRKFGRKQTGLVVLELVGGQRGKPQREALESGVHIVVATPGRLLDHLEHGSLTTHALETLVLDEADRMLDMGFGEEVHRILRMLPAARQTALFSATFPDTIKALSQKYQRNAVHVGLDEGTQDLRSIKQFQLFVEPRDKLRGLCWVLHEFPHESALVFCNFKASVAELTSSLSAARLSVDRLDGDLDQFQRDQVMARFRNQSLRILVATDVAGRGIDVEDLDLVINYELPQEPETYVHRIGRTGRAGKGGLAISLSSHVQDKRLAAIEALLGRPIERLARDPEQDPGLTALLQNLARGPRMETILISGGRKDKLRPGDILGALTGDAGNLQSADVGRIEIQDKLSYVAVSRRLARQTVKRLNSGRIKKKRYRATLVDGASCERFSDGGKTQ